MPTVLSISSVEIYSSYTLKPSFFCPSDAIRCEMYETINGLNLKIDPPLFIKTCQPSTLCSYINNVGGSLGFRFLPGDVSLAAGMFKGYQIIDGEYTTTTTSTTTTIIYHRCKPLYVALNCISCCSPTTTTTTTISTTTIPTTTINSCLSSGYSCTSSSECCSEKCSQKAICMNPTIHGICFFQRVIKECI